MNQQINTIREALTLATDGPIVGRGELMQEALTALAALETAMREPVAEVEADGVLRFKPTPHKYEVGDKLYLAAPPAQLPQHQIKVGLEWVDASEGSVREARAAGVEVRMKETAQRAQPTVCEGCTQPGYCRQNGCLQPKQAQPESLRYSPDGEGGMELDSLGGWVKWRRGKAQGEAVPWHGVDEQKLLSQTMKPKEIDGNSVQQHERVQELLHWFVRFADGGANPKWLHEHAFELAYYIAIGAMNRAVDVKAATDAAYIEGFNVPDNERATLHRIDPMKFHAGPRAQPVVEAKQSGAVPQGYVLVPVEPTDRMVQAAHHLDLSYMPGQEGADRAAIYRAMLAAAPQQKGGGHVG